MRKKIVLGLAIITSIAIFGMNSCDKKKNVKLTSKNDTINWVLGENMARGFKETGIDIDKDIIIAAIENHLDGKESKIDDTTFAQLLQEITIMIYSNQEKKLVEATEKAKEQESVFFEQLKASDPDVKSTESGLHYKVIQQGEGQNAYMGGRVRFHYRASFADGRVFDQTYDVREPILTVLNNIFPGLQEGLMMMNAKSKYIFYIPSRLAFGHQGTTDVPPYSTVIYEVELLQVLK